ncbi:MAG: 2-amino-4-hydroxy-6-hydroxymethyldihydropteridine diphosphokinase [Bacteroidetes bacterium]|nr:2-amino-4-hydroxy-6-hydroxymethyldihydropteridine diphosphokinase [Bacteroidota bacterium]
MATAYLLLGSNQGDRQSNIAKAISLIKEAGILVNQASALYQTAAWGKEDQPDFLNKAIQITTTLAPPDLLIELKRIEKQVGRKPTEKWGARVIDIDILFYEAQIIETTELVIPHPYIQERRFTLLPLAEIAPAFIHPVFHKSIEQLLKECPDSLEVKPFKDQDSPPVI